MVAKPHFAQLRDTGNTYLNRVNRFEHVVAYATAGGASDRAYLYDSAANDIFVGKPALAEMRDEAGSYWNQAAAFDRVYAYATAGGASDRAYLYDSTGDDIFVGKSNYALMKRSDLAYYTFAKSFDHVEAFATSGYDRAFLYGTAGTEHLTLTPTDASFHGDGFLHRTSGFDRTRVKAGGGTDYAYFEQVGSSDRVYGRHNYAHLQRNADDYWAYDFELIKAYAQAGETPTADVAAVDYLFQQFGSWQ